MYTLGRKFKLRIDNKAVALINNNPLAKPPSRIQRWSLRLSSYDFIVEHIPELGNIAEFLSRHAALKEDVDETEDYINSIFHYSLPKHVNKQKILEATLIDPVLIKLTEAVKKNKIEKDVTELQPFSRVFDELTLTTEDLIFRDNRLLVPTSLQTEIIQIAHEGHLGIPTTKHLLRSKVWFPNKDIQVAT